jgi:signal-transduction protein with cAMP-binding, CBS, and nucleotidyltransferase domain
MATAELLRSSPLFAQFDDATLERIAGPFSEVEFPANHVLIESRIPGAGMFVICEGTVIVEVRGFERELGRGDVVGEVSLVEDDGLRRARVVSKTPLRCLALDRAGFEHLAEAEPQVADAIRALARDRRNELDSSG